MNIKDTKIMIVVKRIYFKFTHWKNHIKLNIMAIKKVWIEEGCTVCGLCEELCPEVFEVDDEAVVKDGADIENNEEGIKDAAENCPVEIIKFEE